MPQAPDANEGFQLLDEFVCQAIPDALGDGSANSAHGQPVGMPQVNGETVQEQRRLFADFLDRLAAGKTDSEQWMACAVNHYFDPRLEEIRRQCVRLAIEKGDWRSPSEQDQAQLQAWARELRGSGSPKQ